MSLQYLYSVILEISAHTDSQLPATTGHQTHALFLDLVHQIDSGLSARLHDDPHYRPFSKLVRYTGCVLPSSMEVHYGIV